MLTFNLKKEWYEKLRSGEKTIEYREVKLYWRIRFGILKGDKSIKYDEKGALEWILPIRVFPCVLRLGYTKRHMTADITWIEVMDGKDTDLHIDKPVYAIHLANVRERI